MSRILVVAAALLAAPQALACGMYIPPSQEVNLAQLFEAIDAPEQPEVKVEEEVPEADAAEANKAVDTPNAEA